MQFIIWFLYMIVLNFIETNQVIPPSTYLTDVDTNPLSIQNNSNETHCAWFLYPPWKLRNDLFNDKPYNHSENYFGISKDDQITNQSYLESSKIITCTEINLTFYSKVQSSEKNVHLILFLFKQNGWNKTWEYRHNDSQWKFHQLTINLTHQSEYIRFRLVPVFNAAYRISIGITILNISTYTNCQNEKLQLKNQASVRGSKSAHPFIFVIFGGTFLVIFIVITVLFIYGIIEKQCHKWTRNRLNTHQTSTRKTRNAIRDESTIMNVGTNYV